MVRKKRTGVEWIGGLRSIPTYVTGEGEPYRPDALFWMGADGVVLGSTMGKPGEVLGQARASLEQAMERPILGPPHVPDSVRVSSPELAAALREGYPDLDVRCAPTPELDAFVASMCRRLEQEAEGEKSYLSPEIGPDAMASFFRAAAGLFRAKPWELVPGDQSLLSVSIEKLGVHEAVLSVIGQMGERLGFILFSGLDDFEAFLGVAAAIERGEEPAMARHFVLNFERGAEMSTALREEVAAHQWELAGQDAYPWLSAVDEDIVGRPPTAREVTIAEAIALALPELLQSKDALDDAWDGGEPVVQTRSVRTHAGELEVTLRTLDEGETGDFEPSWDPAPWLDGVRRTVDKATVRAKKARRKAARKARRKNR
jgi:hypothetical protein